MPRPRAFCERLASLGVPNSVGTFRLVPADQRRELASFAASPCGNAAVVIDRTLALHPRAPGERRDRGTAWVNQGRLERGIADWERYLTEFPNAADHEQVRGQLRRVRQKLAQLN